MIVCIDTNVLVHGSPNIGQIPGEVVKVAAFGVGTAQNGVKLAGQEGGGIVLLKVEQSRSSE